MVVHKGRKVVNKGSKVSDKEAVKDAEIEDLDVEVSDQDLESEDLDVEDSDQDLESEDLDVEVSDQDLKSEDLDVEVSDQDSESEEDEGDAKPNAPPQKAVYDRAGLLDKLGDVSWPENVEWLHKLTLNFSQEKEVDVNDDLNRELAFYTQALDSTREAFMKFESMDMPFLRPSDYYAEMVKSDNHMEKVRGRLLAEKRRIEEAEERRKARENKKMSKDIQAQKLRERAKEKKNEIESVKKWRKQRQQSGFAGNGKDTDIGLSFEDGNTFERSNKKRPGVHPGDRSGGKARQGAGKGKPGADKKRKGRDFKESKYGFGGRKGMKKQNTAETTNDMRDFSKSFSKNKKRKT
ncbi:putative rRNA-processing protein EBP2-like [Heracleum sosnowskyi]|uniref:rRNA-processing protein EBP2-like n=1 Tax=Heracleum sosnowskyi TaxID=360622 RepID=A0AAD8HI07_9APIA|nr:putative rRNA-processing protein EBP2-like [Heracleum sosnowskyi]